MYQNFIKTHLLLSIGQVTHSVGVGDVVEDHFIQVEVAGVQILTYLNSFSICLSEVFTCLLEIVNDHAKLDICVLKRDFERSLSSQVLKLEEVTD